MEYLKNPRVLVVDHEQHSLDDIVQSIKELLPGAFVSGSRFASDALATALENPPDIALLDIAMPGTGGIALAKRLKEIHPATNIIFVTDRDDHYRDAMELHASGYILKPVTHEKLAHELSDLRRPLPQVKRKVHIQTFGNFELFIDEEPVRFQHKKTKELLAFLVDRRGALCENDTIIATLWEEDENAQRKKSYLRNLRSDLLTTLSSYGCENIIITHRGEIGLRTDAVSCDYYDFLAKDPAATTRYHGEYMQQYSWAEMTNGALSEALQN